MVESSPVEPRASVAIKSTYEMIEVLLNNKLPGTLGKTAHAISVLKEEHVALQEKFQDACMLLKDTELWLEEFESCGDNGCTECKDISGSQRVKIMKLLDPKSAPALKKCSTCKISNAICDVVSPCLANDHKHWTPIPKTKIVIYKKCPTCGEFGHCSYTIKECICNKFEKWVPRKGENN